MILDLSHRRKQAVLGFRLAQHRLFRPVRSKPAKNLGQTRQCFITLLLPRLRAMMTHVKRGSQRVLKKSAEIRV